MWLRVWRFLKPFHRDFLWFTILMVAAQVLALVNGYRLSFIIDNVPSHKDDTWFWAVFFVAVIAFDLIYIVVDMGVDWHIITKHDYPIDRYARLQGVGFLMGMDPAWHEERESGALIGNINNGGDKIGSLVSSFSWDFYPAIVQTVVSFVPLLVISSQTVLVAVVCLPVFIGISFLSNKKRAPLREERNELYDKQWALMVEMVQSVETLRQFAQINEFLRRLRVIADQIVAMGMKEHRIAMLYNGIRMVALHGAWILTFLVWKDQLASGSVGVAQIVFANGLLGSILGQIWKYASLLDKAFDYSEPIRRFLDMMGESVNIPDEGTFADKPSRVTVDFRDVSFAYPGSIMGIGNTIEGVSFSIHPGEKIALVGPSGGGKTTVMKVMMRLYLHKLAI